MFLLRLEIDEVDLVLPAPERGLARFHEPNAIFLRDGEAVLDHLAARAAQDAFRVSIRNTDLTVTREPQVTRTREDGEGTGRRGTRAPEDPERRGEKR